MPKTEAPFAIAVIREKENYLLSNDDLTRILHADTLHDAREALMSTPYALYLSDTPSIQNAVSRAMEAEFAWLFDLIDEPRALAFMAARYDLLHLAQAILALASGAGVAQSGEKIGTLSHEIIHAMVFTDSFVPEKEDQFFFAIAMEQKEAIKSGTWNANMLFSAMEHALEERLEVTAYTPFMKRIADLAKEKHAADHTFRTQEALLQDTAEYERQWDTTLLALAKEQKYEVIGYDPVIAYWIIKEMEAKTITMVFSAIAGGFSKEKTQSLARTFS